MKRSIFAVMLVALFAVSAFGEMIPVQIDGAVGKLSAVIQKPELKDGQKCPLVMILHGFTGSKNDKLLTTFADALVTEGIASIRFDFNGHGESDGDFVNMTVLNEIEDAKQVYEYVRDLRYVSDVSISGHSQGGVVSSMLA
ncbi:MAG: alpha/beta hydrolase, partial [Synergistaceae bacterium]|nr:alpha/beta hydrolase [Synergistaceae bacterium]